MINGQYRNKILNANCLDVLKELPDKCIDLLFTDPPYGIGMSKNAGLSDKYTAKEWDKDIPSKKIFDEMFRVSKNQIIFGGNYFIKNAETLAGVGSWAVWDKRCGVIPERTFADGELIWVSYKKPLRIFRYIWDGMLQQDMKNKDERFHPTQKPLKLCQQIISYYTGIQAPYMGEPFLVADFFSGSGTTALAAYNLGLDYLCTELEKEYFEKSVERLNNATAQMGLFR